MKKEHTYKTRGGASLIALLKVLHIALHPFLFSGGAHYSYASPIHDVKFDTGIITYIDNRKEEAHENDKSTGGPAERTDAAK